MKSGIANSDCGLRDKQKPPYTFLKNKIRIIFCVCVKSEGREIERKKRERKDVIDDFIERKK